MSLITGSGNSKLNLVVAIIDGIVARIGFALLLGRVFQLGVVGYWYGHAIAGFMPFFIGGVFYLTGNWYKKRYIMKD
jgi:Na+-driven multidrug efflux pump